MAGRKADQPNPATARLIVTYDDGTTAKVHPNRPALLLAMEREWGVSEPQKVEHVWWLAWHGLGRPTGDLDKWLETVASIEGAEEGKGQPS